MISIQTKLYNKECKVLATELFEHMVNEVCERRNTDDTCNGCKVKRLCEDLNRTLIYLESECENA